MNNIPHNQLQTKALDCLAAQRYLYSKAKKVQAWQIVLCVPCVAVWSLLVFAFPELKVWGAMWGGLVTLLDPLLFNRWQQSLKQQAAKIQELFDSEVLQLEWRALKVGNPPDAEAIAEASANYKRKHRDYSALRDWYPVSVGQLPLYLGRIICQRANCWWDSKLRRRYATGVGAIVGTLSVFVFSIGLIGGFTVDRFFMVVIAPLMPAFALGTRQYTDHQQSATALDRLKEHAEKIWKNAKEKKSLPEELTKESRDLQDEIYDCRRKNPLIFDWIYTRLKRDHEIQMNVGAETLIEEAKAAGFGAEVGSHEHFHP
jgi:predicted pore-forming effector associated with SMODS systems